MGPETERLIEKVAGTDAPVLLLGETGTGKEVIAREIHRRSARRHKPLVTVHCAAIPEQLLESELFGYEKGAFTGAATRKPGRLELADGGTVLLDELGDISLGVQVKLLRVLQERAFDPLGATAPRTSDIRFIAATHRDLERLIEDGAFREDLYYRVSVLPIRVPPLRERPEVIPPLVAQLCAEFTASHGGPQRSFSTSALAHLQTRPWRGNVRELANFVERTLILSDAVEIDRESLEKELQPISTPSSKISSSALGAQLAATEADAVREALRRTGDNKTEAARLLGVSRRTLYNKLDSLRRS